MAFERLHVVNTFLANRIVIARVLKDDGETAMIGDERKDVTEECVKAVMEHMDGELNKLKNGNNCLEFTIKGKGTLSWTRPKINTDDV